MRRQKANTVQTFLWSPRAPLSGPYPSHAGHSIKAVAKELRAACNLGQDDRKHLCLRYPGRLRGPEFLLRIGYLKPDPKSKHQGAAVRLAMSSFKPGPIVEVTDTFLM